MKYFCTYFDRNYLARGIAMIQSLREHSREPFTIFVVCMDEITRLLLKSLDLVEIQTIPMHEIEDRDQKLLDTRFNRSATEYLWTTTPTIILRVIEQHPEIDLLTYLDADMYFFADPAPVFHELATQSILIHEHRFSKRLEELVRNGIYNVGLLCFRNNQVGLEALRWWRERCIEWCYSRIEDGKMGDQGYLNDWPVRFPEVTVCQNIGIGTAPWNIEKYTIGVDLDGRPTIDEQPIILYHFHNLKLLRADLIVPAAELIFHFPAAYLKICLLPYAKALFQTFEVLQSLLPSFESGMTSTDLLTESHTFLARKELCEHLDKVGVPQKRVDLDTDWVCYCSNQVLEVQANIQWEQTI